MGGLIFLSKFTVVQLKNIELCNSKILVAAFFEGWPLTFLKGGPCFFRRVAFVFFEGWVWKKVQAIVELWHRSGGGPLISQSWTSLGLIRVRDLYIKLDIKQP